MTVSFRNHKFFFLLLLYSAAACNFITITMIPSASHLLWLPLAAFGCLESPRTVESAVQQNSEFAQMRGPLSLLNCAVAVACRFLVLFAETLSAFLGILITFFFLFHIWLALQAERKPDMSSGLGDDHH